MWSVCTGFKSCNVCRNRDRGRRFRTQVLKNHLDMKGVVIDFDCPEGRDWTVVEPEQQEDVIIPDVIGNILTVAVNPILVGIAKQRFEICKTCDKATENGHKCSLHKACCFGAWRSRPESKCYEGKW